MNEIKEIKSCICNDTSLLIMDRRQVSRCTALFLAITCGIFTMGYFWGKNQAIESYVQAMEEESFADKLHYSMSLLYDNYSHNHYAQDNHEEDSLVASQEQAQTDLKQTQTPIVAQSDTREQSHAWHQAQLVGYPTIQAARNFVATLQKKGIHTSIVKRTSKSKKRIVYWYQIVTDKFARKEDLMTVVNTIKKLEKIHDVRLVTSHDQKTVNTIQ